MCWQAGKHCEGREACRQMDVNKQGSIVVGTVPNMGQWQNNESNELVSVCRDRVGGEELFFISYEKHSHLIWGRQRGKKGPLGSNYTQRASHGGGAKRTKSRVCIKDLASDLDGHLKSMTGASLFPCFGDGWRGRKGKMILRGSSSCIWQGPFDWGWLASE